MLSLFGDDCKVTREDKGAPRAHITISGAGPDDKPTVVTVALFRLHFVCRTEGLVVPYERRFTPRIPRSAYHVVGGGRFTDQSERIRLVVLGRRMGLIQCLSDEEADEEIERALGEWVEAAAERDRQEAERSGGVDCYGVQ